MKVFNINDSYFKYQKCLSGITYQFMNQLDNIYEKNLMVGTNYCIYCMYNEFDIINNFMINLYQVDVGCTTNIDLDKRYYELDGAYLRTGHRVLLVGQDDTTENDVYNVDSRGFLILSDELATTGKTWRYKAYVKLGDNKGKQFHLINSGNRFPLKGERKEFLNGHGYIVKSLFNYDLFYSGYIYPKLLFTDYEFARISVNRNYELYNGFQFETGYTVDIQYHDNSYLITVDNDTSKYTYTGITSGTTIFNLKDFPTYDYGYETYIETDSTICSNASIYDYVKLEISGDTSLSLKTFIKRIDDPFIIISDYISANILNDYYTGSTSTYTLTNLMYSEQSNVKEIMLESFYSKYFNIDDSDYLYPIENVDNRYFDYDGLKFETNSTLYEFTTNNNYIKYNLYNTLNAVNSYLFDTNYSFLIDYTLRSFSAEYYDDRFNDYIVYPTTLADTKGTFIKIVPYRLSDINYFRKHTYVDVSNETGTFYKSLIVDLVPNEYFVIETYNSGITMNLIRTIYNLKDISDILYDVYKNEEKDYYRVRDDDMRRNICNGYADFISEDIGIIDNLTAFLMQDKQHKFVLKIYDPENAFNGGIVRSPIVYTVLPSLCTIASTAASLKGEIINDGGSSITDRGICYSNSSLSQNNCVSAVIYSTGPSPFTSNVTGLTPTNIYYYKAYATNNLGTSYGDVQTFTTLDPVYTGATLTTDMATPKSHEILVKASVVDIGWTPILSKGIIYLTGATEPSMADNNYVYVPELGGPGQYQINLTGLTHNTEYSYLSYATNICGTTYGQSGFTSTLYPTAPVIETVGYDNVTYNSIDIIGNLVSNDGSLTDPIHGIDEMGVVWSTDAFNLPTTGNTAQPYSPVALGAFTINLTGLTYYNTYYFRSYAINTLYSGDTTSYGDLKSVATLPLPVDPTVQISSVISYGTYTGNTNNVIVSNGNSPIVSKGLYYSTGVTVTVADTFLSATGTTNWQSNLTGLTPTTQYSLMASATNLYGLTGYSSVSGFTTMPILVVPTVTLTYVLSTPTGATLTGNVTNNGYAAVTSRGILYSGVTTSTWLNWYGGTGSGAWSSNITGLTVSNLYYAKSYATNTVGTSYSNDISWTTPSGISPPSFSAVSPTIISVGTIGADVTNEIVSDGGASVTSRGILYSGTTIPTLLNWYGGTGIGSWTTSVTGLTIGGTYYVYAYATNTEGTTYTPSVSFDTLSYVVPTIVINSVSDISQTGATINSEVTSDGYSTVTSRGTTGDTIGLWPYVSGGVGTFSITLTGLSWDTSYTGQSYATNVAGTGWSDNTYFTTLRKNKAIVDLVLTCASSLNPYVYQVGDSYPDVITNVTITPNNVPISELFDGDVVYSSPSGTSVLTWGTGVTTVNNSSSPFTYEPLGSETQYFTANESCGTPPESRYDTKQIDAVYPYLTCNRVPSSPLIPSERTLREWCKDGSFYIGNIPPNNEPMTKKIEIAETSKTYFYTIGPSNNLIYFAHPTGASYGTLSSIVVDGVPYASPITTYVGVQMSSSGLVNDWDEILYNVYAFMVTASFIPKTIYIEYYF